MSNKENALLSTIIEAIQEKKGIDIVSLNLAKLEQSITDHFVICHGNSNTQVEAIAREVEDKVKKVLNIKVWHKDGFKNAQWILLDFANVVVHIFQKEYRDFYNLEGLWADAEIKHIMNDFEKE
ncbi:MAG: ribosome silencing factor [Chlorobi bacterium]|nr:ribosome silencing factor [Chlorobiota bacterium]